MTQKEANEKFDEIYRNFYGKQILYKHDGRIANISEVQLVSILKNKMGDASQYDVLVYTNPLYENKNTIFNYLDFKEACQLAET